MATRDEIIKYLFEAQQIGIDEVIKLLEGTKQKSEEAGNAFEFLKKHMAEIVSVAAAVEIAFKGIEFGKESLKNAEDVESSLSRVRALAGDAAQQFGDMQEAVEKAAQAVNVTSQTSASGLAALVSTGLSAKNAIDALVPTLQLAKIANIDIAQAAELVGKQLDAFHLPASDAQKVVDELTQASHGAAGGLAAMSGAAAQLAPDAKALGLSFTDTVSILGLLSSKGLDAEKSTRGLRTIFQELQDPTSKLRGELGTLGDYTGDFDKAITALNGNTPRAHQALLTLSGSSRTLVEVLGQAGPEALAKFNAGLQQTEGVAERAAKILDDNLKGASTRFGLAIEQIGEKLARPVLEPFKQELEKLAEKLNAFADTPKFKEIEAKVGELATKAAAAIDKFINNFDWDAFLSDGTDALDGVSKALTELADNATAATSAINKTFEAIGGTYHAAAAVVDGAVGQLAKAGDVIVDIAQKTDAASEGAEIAARKFEKLHSVFQSVGGEASAQAAEHIEKLGDDLGALVDATDKAATATKSHGDAAAAATSKITEQAQAADKYEQAEQRLADAAAAVDKADAAQAESARHAAQANQAFAETLRVAADSSRTATADVNALKTAFSALKISSQQDLQQAATDAASAFAVIDKSAANTAEGLADRQNAFLAYAKAALAASAQLDVGARASIQYQLDSKASVLGVTEALADMEKQSDASAAALTSDANREAASFDRAREAADRAAAATQSAGNEAQSTGEKYDRFKDKGEEGFADLTQAIARTRSEFLSISDAAAKFYDTVLDASFKLGHSDDGSGFDRTARAIQQAVEQTTQKIADQRQELNSEIAGIDQLGFKAESNFGVFRGNVEQTTKQLDSMIASIQDGTYDAGLLGQQDLGPLLQSLQAAKQRMDALKAATEQANQQLADLSQQLQDERDQQTGNQTDIENRRYEKQVQQIKDLADKADAAGKAQAEKDLQIAEQIHQKKLKDIADEANARNGGGGAGSGGGGGSSPAPTGGGGGNPRGGGGASGSGSAGAGVPGITHHTTINVNGQSLDVYSDAENADGLQQLVRQMRFAKSRT